MSTSITVDVGDKVRCTGTFTDPDDDSAVTPTAINFRVKAPDGTRTTYVSGTDSEVSTVSAGVYRLLFSCDKAGTYNVRCWSTGTGQAAEAGEVVVEPDPTA